MRLWLALSLCLVPCLPAAARDLSLSVTWAEPARGDIVTVLYLADGNIGAITRNPVGSDLTALNTMLTDLPRQATSVQVALIDDEKIVAQTAPTPLNRTDSALSLMLLPVLALSLRSVFDCVDLGLATLTTAGQVTRLSLTRDGQDVARFLSSDGPLTAPDGTRATLAGTRLTVTARDGTETRCLALPAPPVLPVSARAQDDTWNVAISAASAIVTLPDGVLPTGTAIAPIDAGQSDEGSIVFRSSQFTLTLRASPCQRGSDTVPYPLSAHLTTAMGAGTAGCAGSPLDLLLGRAWSVTTLLGIPVTQDMTMGFAAGQVVGRGTCNRYQANVTFDAGQMHLRNLGTTRVGCATSLRNLELRFLDALERATGFDLGANGMLVLRSGPMPVLTARQLPALR